MKQSSSNRSPWRVGRCSVLLCITLILGGALPGMAAAIITQVSEAEFLALAPGRVAFTEDLEIYPQGFVGTQLDLRNGQHTVNNGSILIDEIFVLGQGLDNVLKNSEIQGERTFDLFPQATIAWGTDLNLSSLGSGAQTFKVNVVGNSGNETFFFNRDDFDTYFAAFLDPLGLISISFENLGHDTGSGNQWSAYYFDDMTTISQVPLPGAPLLFVSAALGLMGFARRNRSC